MTRRPSSLVLAMDMGSSSVRTALFANNATRILSSTAIREYAIRYSRDGGAVLSAPALLRAARNCISQTLQWRRQSPAVRDMPIVAVAGSAFWHSLLALRRNGKPISPIHTWADSRSVPDAVGFATPTLRATSSTRRTGCMVRAPFWPAKLLGCGGRPISLETHDTIGSSPATGSFANCLAATLSSHSMASGTGLYNLRTASWDAELCDVRDVCSGVNSTPRRSARRSDPSHPELRDLPVFSAIGDGAASNLGSGAERRGRIAITIGTSAAVRTVSHETRGERSHSLWTLQICRRRRSGRPRWRHQQRRESAEMVSARLRLPREIAPTTRSRAESRDRCPDDSPLLGQRTLTHLAGEFRGVIIGLAPQPRPAADIPRAATTSTFYRLADILAPRCFAGDGGGNHCLRRHPAIAGSLLKFSRIALATHFEFAREPESSLRGAALLAWSGFGLNRSHHPAAGSYQHDLALPNTALAARANRSRTTVAVQASLRDRQAVPRTALQIFSHRSRISPGRQRSGQPNRPTTDAAIFHERFARSATYPRPAGKVSPQCGQATSVSTIKSIAALNRRVGFAVPLFQSHTAQLLKM